MKKYACCCTKTLCVIHMRNLNFSRNKKRNNLKYGEFYYTNYTSYYTVTTLIMRFMRRDATRIIQAYENLKFRREKMRGLKKWGAKSEEEKKYSFL